jgi:hypothetical protein
VGVEGAEPLVELAAEPLDLAGLLGQRLVGPAVRDGAQQGDQGGGRGQHHLPGGGVLDQVGLDVERGAEEGLGGHEHHHELRRRRQ